MTPYGVYSEVGKLRTVIVCRPGLAHMRLTPENCHDLLFDDIIWVAKARIEHYHFTQVMRERGVEVLEMHDLLAKTLEQKDGRRWVLDRKITANTIGPMGLDAVRTWLDEMPASELAGLLIGGLLQRRSHSRHSGIFPITTPMACGSHPSRTCCIPGTLPAGYTEGSL